MTESLVYSGSAPFLTEEMSRPSGLAVLTLRGEISVSVQILVSQRAGV
jgi:hypothetical protein